MRRLSLSVAARAALVAGAAGLEPTVARGQEFTRQVILVPAFQGTERRLAESVGHAVRSRIQKGTRRNEATVVSEAAVAGILERASIDRSTTDTFFIRTLAREVRADELVQGEVVRLTPTRVRVLSHIVLTRDSRMRQPLPAVEAPNGDSAGTLVAAHVLALRRQMVPLRRCENALRSGAAADAMREGQRGMAQVPNGVLVHICALNAMRATGAGALEILAAAGEVLQLDPHAWWGMDAAARAQDALGNRIEAAAMWRRLAATDTTDLALGRRVVGALVQGGNAAAAVELATQLITQAPDDLELLRLQWQALVATNAWGQAVAVGTRLLDDDPFARSDSTFVWRLSLAHRALGDTLRAVSLAADGAARFPRDSRLYVLYADLIRADSRVAVSRGVTRFPEVADLRLLRAQELRGGGRTLDAVAELRLATALDGGSGQGHLALAQAYAELAMPDSALIEARRALSAGLPRSTVAQFALARGSALSRVAGGTKLRLDYERALPFLLLADSLDSTIQSQFLVGTTALSISQRAATEAPETRSCALSRLANDFLPVARQKITGGAGAAPEASRQYLAYLDELEPVVARQVAALCAGGSGSRESDLLGTPPPLSRHRVRGAQGR